MTTPSSSVMVCLACGCGCREGNDDFSNFDNVNNFIKTENFEEGQCEDAGLGHSVGQGQHENEDITIEKKSHLGIFCNLLGVNLAGIKLEEWKLNLEEGVGGECNSSSTTITVSSSSPFCSNCDYRLRQLLNLKVKLKKVELELDTRIKELKKVCEDAEVTFGSSQIYETDPRYLIIRQQICPIIQPPLKIKVQSTRRSRRKPKPKSCSDLISSDLTIPEDILFQEDLFPVNNQFDLSIDGHFDEPLGDVNLLDDRPSSPEIESPPKKRKVGRPSKQKSLCPSTSAPNSRSSKRKVKVVAEESDTDYSSHPSNDKQRSSHNDDDYNPSSDNNEDSSSEDNNRTDDEEDNGFHLECSEVESPRMRSRIKRIVDPSTGNFTLLGVSYEKLDDGNKYYCVECKISLSTDSIKAHTISKHTDMFPCPHCGKRSSSSKALKKHIRFAHNNPKSRQPDPVTGSITYINMTFEKTENGRYRCPKCSQDYSVRSIHAHVIGQHTNKFVCSECGHHCSSSAELNSHVERLHGKGRTKKECPICGRPCSTLGSRLSKHMATHLGAEEKEAAIARGETVPVWKKEKKYVCDKCGTGYSEMMYLKQHKVREHPNNEELTESDKLLLLNKEMCPECGKMIGRHHLRKHLAAVHKKEGETVEKRFLCSICEKRFSRMVQLRYHKQAVHEQLRQFQCSSCPRQFLRKTDLKYHVNICQNIRPFQCKECSMAFGRKYHLDRHIQNYHVEGANPKRSKYLKTGGSRKYD